MKKYRKQEAVVVRGLVSPAGWNTNGTIRAVCIVSDNDEHYFVDWSDYNHTGLEFIKKYVEATGILTIRNGLQHISVTDIKMTTNPDW